MEKNEKDYLQIRKILSEMKSGGISEIEINENGKKLLVKYKPLMKSQPAEQEIAKPLQTQQIENLKPFEKFYILKSAVVGYCLIQGKKEDSDEIEPIVQVGDKVGLEDILCMIECMRGQVHHEVKLKGYKDFPAEHGIIEEILVEHEQSVDYGKPLMKIKPVSEQG
jgi:biotin carboxyl carrier protein